MVPGSGRIHPGTEEYLGKDLAKIGQGANQAHTVEGSGQVVLNGVPGSSTTRGDPDLAKDRGQVRVDRAGTDHELFGHLLIRQSLGHQPQHLHFTCRQSIRIGRSFGNWWN